MKHSGPLEHGYRRGVRWSLFGATGVTLIQFLQMLVFARWAGPAAAGDYALAAACIGFLTPLAEAGLSQAVVQADDIRPGQLATMTGFNFMAGAAVFGLLTLASPWLAAWYGRSDLAGLLPLMGFSLLLMPLGAAPGGLLTRALRFDVVARIEMAASAAGFFLFLALAMAGWGIWSMACGFLARQLVSALASFWFSGAFTGIDWRHPASLRSIWPLLRFGSYDLGARWADFLANYLDKLIVGKWLGAAALGYYNLAFSLLVLPTARLGYLFTRVSFPVFARLRGSRAAVQEFFQRTATELIGLLFPVYLGMLLFAREIIQILYGPQWLSAAPVLQAFAVAGWVRSLNAVFPQLIKGLGRPQWQLQWMLLWTLMVNAVLAGFLTLKPTVESAAWSRVAAKLLLEIPMLIGLGKICQVSFERVLFRAANRLLWLLPIAVGVFIADGWNGDFWLRLAMKMAIFCLGLIGLGWWSPFRSDWLRLSQFSAPAPDK